MPPVPARRPAAVVAAPVAKNYVSFGSLDFYSGSRQIPEGDYAVEFNWQNFQPKKQDGTPAGASRLVVMASHYNLLGGAPIEFPLGVGEKTHESFQPDPDNPKCLLAVPGGPGQSISKMSNWAIYLNSLYFPVSEPEAGMPQGILDNDFSVIDGIHLHVKMEPEPEMRKNMPKSATAELQGEERKGNGLVPMVMQILEGGRPWEGGGGFPEEGVPAAAPVAAPVRRAPAAPARPVAAAPAKPAAKAPARPAAAAPAPVAASGVDENLLASATMAAADVLAANPTGLERAAFRMELFKILQKGAGGPAEANAIVKPLFASDAALNQLTQPLGFTADSGNILPMQ